MKTFNFFMKTLVFVLLLAFSIRVNAQNAPIGCDSKFFVSYGSSNNSTSNTTVNQLNLSGGTITGIPFPIQPSAIGFNGMGLNPIDGYIYALRYPPSGDKVHLVKVGMGTPGNVTDLGEVKNASGSQLEDNVIVYSGCFDAAGTFYFVTTNDRLFSMSSAQLGNGAGQRNATYIATLNVPDYFADIAIDPATGQMYGVTITNDFGVYTINKLTGAVNRLGTYPNNGASMIGLFFTENSNLYAYRTNGAFYLLNKTNGSGTFAGNGPSFTFADGCSCSFRVGHDLDAPTAICPTVQNGGQPPFNFTLKIQNLSGAARSGTTYTLTMSNRFTFTQTPAVIAAKFAASGLTNSGAVLSSASGGVNNVLVVNNMNIPNLAAVPDVLIGAKLVNHIGFTTANFQSVISGLPAGIGSTDLSNDPKTSTPDDPTVIGRCPGIILGTKLLSFTGSLKNDKTSLVWETENEINTDHYEIERSTDGTNFQSIGSKTSKSIGGGKENYQYDDPIGNIAAYVFYYRLKIVDRDGNFTYSNILLMRKNKLTTDVITVSPNPLPHGAKLTINYTTLQQGKADLRIMDMTGKIVQTKQAVFSEGNNTILLDNLDKLIPGIYILQVSHNDKLSVIKFILGQ